MKALVIAFSLILAACGAETVELNDSSTVAINSEISRENAQYNAEKYMEMRYPGHGESAYMNTDSAIDGSCENGDGFATGILYLVGGNEVTLKCQTNGSTKGTKGCMDEAMFYSRPYSRKEHKCDLEITVLESIVE